MAIPGYPNETHYSPHFSRRELDCRCGCETPPHIQKNIAEHAQVLEKYRAVLGVPMHVHCCYRCPRHNAAVGGKPASQHLVGKGTDFHTKAHTPAQLAREAEKVPELKDGGIHAYSWGTHVDNRGYRARWQ